MNESEEQWPNDMLAGRLTGEAGDPMGPFTGSTQGEAPATARREAWVWPGSSGRSEAKEAETTKRQMPWKRALAGAVIGTAALGAWAPANAYAPGANTLAPPPPARESAVLSWAATIPPTANWLAAAQPVPTKPQRVCRATSARWVATVSFVDTTPINTTDLADMRGGFVLPNGMNLEFGAVIETVRNGVTLLRTEMNFIDKTTTIVNTVRDGITTSDTLNKGQGFETTAGSLDTTTVVHQLTPTNIGAVINNVTPNTDILNTTQFNIKISNFSQITNNMQATRLNRLSNITTGSVLNGLGL